jgi:hypothetical protein
MKLARLKLTVPSLVAFATPGEYWFASLVDSQDLVKETNEQNNFAKRIVTVK